MCVAILQTCKRTPHEPEEKNVQLSSEDVAVTETYLRMRILPDVQHDAFRLTRNGATILTSHYTGADTLLLDEQLLPKHTYKYKVYALNNSVTTDSSALLTITTMDTTSHNFTFEIDTLGDGNSSVLYDVAIINDTLAYAVGEIYLKDSVGNFEIEPYNIVKWNGREWKLEKVYWHAGGVQGTAPRRAIFAFSPDDIWIEGPAHWNGIEWIEYNFTGFTDGRINKIWGTSSSNLYMVGDNGTIVHFNGSTWTKIESGTTIHIKDIWGSKNQKTNKFKIIALASQGFELPSGRKLFVVNNLDVSEVSNAGLPLNLHGCWFISGHGYYTTGGKLYYTHSLNNQQNWQNIPFGITNYYLESIRGNEINDISIVGDFGEFLHFNGTTWKSYRVQTTLNYGVYYSVTVRGNLAIAVGENVARGIIALGRRN